MRSVWDRLQELFPDVEMRSEQGFVDIHFAVFAEIFKLRAGTDLPLDLDDQKMMFARLKEELQVDMNMPIDDVVRDLYPDATGPLGYLMAACDEIETAREVNSLA